MKKKLTRKEVSQIIYFIGTILMLLGYIGLMFGYTIIIRSRDLPNILGFGFIVIAMSIFLLYWSKPTITIIKEGKGFKIVK